MFSALKLTAEQVIDIKEILDEKNDGWEQKRKIMEKLTQEQRLLFHQMRQDRPGDRPGPGGRKPFKRHF